MHMEKKNLTFGKAIELLFGWNPVCYSELSQRVCIFEVPMLTSIDIQNLSEFSGWYISCGSYTVEVIVKNPYQL